MRFFARSDQKSELRLGSEDIVDGEVPQSSEEAALSTDTNSKGQGTLQDAMALIIGTSVGAGILAIPARTMNAVCMFTTLTRCCVFFSMLISYSQQLQ